MAGFVAHGTAVEGLMAVAGESDHRFPRHTHDEYGFGLVVSGGQLSASGRGQVEAGPGDIITVNPGEVHDGMPVGDRGRRWHMFYVTPALMADLAEGLGVARPGSGEFHHPVLNQPQLAAPFSAAWNALAGPACCDAEPLAAEDVLLPLLSGLLGERSREERAGAAPAIARLRAMIDDDILATPQLADLAREAGLSRFQTLRAFARETGFTPRAYLLERRVRTARQSILNGGSLADTAAACGFADQSHMTREFKRRFGLTPAAFRAAVGCNPVQDRIDRIH